MAWNHETNIKGPKGDQGDIGPPGPGVVFKGSVPTEADLPTGASPGDMYITEDTDTQYVWDGTTWIAGTSLTGPPGPQGNPGADSTVPGPPGADSTVPGPKDQSARRDARRARRRWRPPS